MLADRSGQGFGDQDDDLDAEEAMREMMEQDAAAGAQRPGSGRTGGPEPLFAPGEPDDEELAALLEMEEDM
jgi:hypothetical protein